MAVLIKQYKPPDVERFCPTHSHKERLLHFPYCIVMIHGISVVNSAMSTTQVATISIQNQDNGFLCGGGKIVS